MHIQIRHDPAAERIVFQVINDPVHLVHHPFPVLVLHPHLIAISLADAHIYDRHIPIIKELIGREPLEAPAFWLNPDIHDFYRFTRDDVKVENYQAGPQVDIPVAI